MYHRISPKLTCELRRIIHIGFHNPLHALHSYVVPRCVSCSDLLTFHVQISKFVTHNVCAFHADRLTCEAGKSRCVEGALHLRTTDKMTCLSGNVDDVIVRHSTSCALQ